MADWEISYLFHAKKHIFLSQFFSDDGFNHEQNIVDKFIKSSKLVVSLECFTADFSNFSSVIVGIWVLVAFRG